MTRADGVAAAVLIGPRRFEMRRLPLPATGPDDGLLRVECAGVCGSDVPVCRDGPSSPLVLGHEVVGVIERVGPAAAARWGVREGDRVVPEEYLPCGHCRWCRSGEHRICDMTDIFLEGGAPLRYGSTPVAVWPGLWGGFAERMYLHPASVLHPIADSVPAGEAALALPLANGLQWVTRDGAAGPGSAVVVIGPGQQGLACVAAARMAGAGVVLAVGLAADRRRLRLAARLGADRTVESDAEDLEAAVRDATGGEGASLVVLAAASGGVLEAAIRIAGKRATIVTAGLGPGAVGEGVHRALVARHLTLKGVRGHQSASVRLAIELLETRRWPFGELGSHHVSLAEAAAGLELVGDGGEAVHVTISPDLPAGLRSE